MHLKNGNSTIQLSDKTGALISYIVNGKEFCAESCSERALITLKLLDDNGCPYYYTSNEATSIKLAEENNGCIIAFDNIKDTGICCVSNIRAYEKEGFSWRLSIQNPTGKAIEWVEYPQMKMANTMIGNGGKSKLFWPAVEGVLVEDPKLRAESMWKYREITRKTCGYNGAFPGSTVMQFMAFYDDESGLYLGAQDPLGAPKVFEWYEDGDGIVLELRNFCNGATDTYESTYDIVTASYEGEWQEAAEIYRSWMEKNVDLPQKICDNKKLPDWMEESPVIVLYPIRGTMDRGDMTPNEYYPYENILPFIDKYAEQTGSKIMALLMHWEGTAPWATPYVWPPYGGEEEFKKLVSALHAKGNLVGVYCSGIGWTTKSFLDPSLDFADKYDESLMCRTPEGYIEQSYVIGPPIREGYDMCPFSDKVGDIVVGEVMSIAESGCDYAQYFDQNLGGESSFCYAKDHGHPSTPGVWQNEAMIRIFKRVNKELEKSGTKMIIGCEGAAAEPFIKYLPFNDLRYEVTFFSGKPVPAYSYLFHEYLNNFMGNQNLIEMTWDFEKNPECLLFRIAYSFAAGDLITFPLGKSGNVHWGWDVPWDVKAPEQEPIFRLTKNLNVWRREYKEFLHTGRMVKARPLSETGKYVLNLVCGSTMEFQSLITVRWQSQEGVEKQVIVNFLDKEQTCQVECDKVYATADSCGERYTGSVTIPPLSAIWVE